MTLLRNRLISKYKTFQEKTPEETTPEKSQPRRPKGGAMMMPGMGFGGNILAEMKLKKMSKKSVSY